MPSTETKPNVLDGKWNRNLTWFHLVFIFFASKLFLGFNDKRVASKETGKVW